MSGRFTIKIAASLLTLSLITRFPSCFIGGISDWLDVRTRISSDDLLSFTERYIDHQLRFQHAEKNTS